MMNCLPVTVAVEVVSELIQLVHFYIDTVYNSFLPADLPYGLPYLSEKAGRLVVKLRDLRGMAAEGTVVSALAPATLSEAVDLRNESLLYGLPARITAFESLFFMIRVLKSIHRPLRDRLPPTHIPALEAFYADTVAVLPELHWFAYKNIVAGFMSFDKLRRAMTEVRRLVAVRLNVV